MDETKAEAIITGAEEVAWNLADLYAAGDDRALEKDFAAVEAAAREFAERYRGRVAGLDAGQMAALLGEYEQIEETGGKIGSYAYLSWSANTEDPARGALLQRATEFGSRISQQMVFFTLEWANAPDDAAAALLADPSLARWRHYLEVERQYRPYLLSEPEEKILAEKSVTGRSAWARFFGEMHSAMRYDFNGEKLPATRVLTALYSPDREVRRAAAASITAGLRELNRSNTFVFNNIAADKASDDRLRSYPTWITARNLSNQVDDSTVQALVDAVTSRYDIVARYYRLKQRLLGLDELFDYDRYAPLPAADRRYRWDEARTIVLEAYGKFDPRMADTAQQFFDNRWIDAAVRPGKVGGAYSHPVVPSVHPYVLMNYEGKPRDVSTLAHELGHGVHQALARRQGIMQANTPLTTAETASVFGEMLVFQDLLQRETNPQVRLGMLTGQLEDAFATVFRQVAMNRFEDRLHTARRDEGELPPSRLNEIWLESQRAMFEDSVTLTEDYGLWWSYVPHFIQSPGYVYAYAFGQLLVLALYARYRQQPEGFSGAYLEMLAAGGSDWPHEIVKPLGVDLQDPSFWHAGLAILDNMVAEAEAAAA